MKKLKKKTKIILIASAAAVCLLAGGLAFLYGTPGQYLMAARRCETNPSFTQSTLAHVPDGFRDTAQLKRYADALVLAEQDQYTEAIAQLKELGDYRRAVAHWEELTYRYAASLREKGQYDEAIAQFEASYYEDYKTQVTRTKYEKAAFLEQNGDFSAAAELFGSLGDYSDSPAKRLNALVSDAHKKVSDGNTKEAAEIMDTVTKESGDFASDASEIYFAHAMTLMEEKDWANAITRLDLCEKTDEVTEKRDYCASMLTYNAALAMMEAGDYAGAVDLFDTIPGFLDADEYNFSCEQIAYKWQFDGFLSKDGTTATKTTSFVRADTIYIYGTLSGGKPGRHIDLQFTWIDAVGGRTDVVVKDWIDGTSGGVTFSYSVPRNANTGRSNIYIYNEETGEEIAKFPFTVNK